MLSDESDKPMRHDKPGRSQRERTATQRARASPSLRGCHGGKLYATGTAVLIGKVCPDTLNCLKDLPDSSGICRQMIAQIVRFIAATGSSGALGRNCLAGSASRFAARACSFGALTCPMAQVG